MRTRAIALVVAAGLLGLGSCQRPPEGTHGIARHTQALDFETGDILGTVIWNGAAVSGGGARAMMALIPGVTSQPVDETTGSFLFENLPPGSKQIQLFADGCAMPEMQLAAISAPVFAATTTTPSIDITGSAGRVIGNITVNGLPATFGRIHVLDCQNWLVGPAGEFALYLPPGSYTARFIPPTGLAGSFSFSVVAGQVTDLGTVALQTGSLQGTVTWNGGPVTGPEATALVVKVPGAPWQPLDGATGGFSFESLVPGDKTVRVAADGFCNFASNVLAETSAAVSGGTTATAVIDIGTSAGRVHGSVTVNGQPLMFATIGVNNCSAWNVRFGQFALYVPAGTQQLEFRTSSGLLGAVSVTVTAGQDVDVGVLALDSASLQGTVSWNGAAVSGAGAQAMKVEVVDLASQQLDAASGGFDLANLAPGPATVNLHAQSCGDSSMRLDSQAVTLTGGAMTTADFDISGGAGRVAGTITVNGAPLSFGAVGIGNCTPWRMGEQGELDMFLPPGTHLAEVFGQSGRIGTFQIGVVAGQTTDVDSGGTPAGSNVSIQLGGGLTQPGGLSVTFATVSQSGDTTVVESGAGPPPPSGYRILGLGGQPRYWDIDTSAGYTGPITVCIRYDGSQVNGPERNLRLVHDAGQGFANITTTIDQANDIICGTTTSLSPFAVVEPLSPPPSIDDLCPCDGSWNNHGAYVTCVRKAAQSFVTEGRITAAERDALVSAAARSRCGHR